MVSFSFLDHVPVKERNVEERERKREREREESKKERKERKKEGKKWTKKEVETSTTLAVAPAWQSLVGSSLAANSDGHSHSLPLSLSPPSAKLFHSLCLFSCFSCLFCGAHRVFAFRHPVLCRSITLLNAWLCFFSTVVCYRSGGGDRFQWDNATVERIVHVFFPHSISVLFTRTRARTKQNCLSQERIMCRRFVGFNNRLAVVVYCNLKESS